MLMGQPPHLGFSGLRSTVFALLAAACSAQSPSTPRNEAPETPEKVTRNDVMGPMRLSPEQARELTSIAKRGNVDAMLGLASHHITAGELKEARYWLGEAVGHGDCHSVQIFEETYLKVPPQELAHWRSEGRRLGCDPDKDYLGVFDKR